MASLREYHSKRDPDRTSEPMPRRRTRARTAGDGFVIQEHHASALHWDFRLERDGVLVSWAIPKGIPPDPKVNHLAVHVEDHPLEYASFEGAITEGEYGGGEVTIWDRGSYDTQKWTDREVMVVLHGERAQGRFVLFQTGGKNWMIHRMDGPLRPDWQPLPEGLTPMLASAGQLPPDGGWSFEMRWDGVRALLAVDGGRVRATSQDGGEVTRSYPELPGLGEQLGSVPALLDSEIVSLDDSGRPSAQRLRRRADARSASTTRRLAHSDPVVVLLVDLLHLDGRSMLESPHEQRRQALVGLDLAGPSWQTPPVFVDAGAAAVRASAEQGLGGVVAKRSDSTYTPGRRSPMWVSVDNEA